VTIKERIAELTQGVTTQVELDAVVSRTKLPGSLRAEFPNADASEIMYEWKARKMQIRRDV
jgi:hypothetical protein